MKKIISLVISVLLITALLTSCGASTKAPSVNYGGMNDSAGMPAPMPSAAAEMGMPAKDQGVSDESSSSSVANGTSMTSSNINTSFTEKIIYSYNAQIETTKFEESVKNVGILLNKYGAFIETSYISGNSYGYKSYRSADYTIRVPVTNFSSLTGSLTILGNIFSENTNAQNITAQFTDTQSRLDTFRTEEGRLLVMLEKATTVEDMITIESRLSDIRYQIESLTSTLRNWQNQVDYSTVTIHIAEVAELTEQVPVQRTYWEKLWDGVQSTLKGIGSFFKGLFMGIVIALPVLVILAVIAVIVIVIIRAANKKKRTNNNQDIDKKE